MSAGLHSKWNRTLTWMLSAALIAQGGTVVYAGDLGDEAAVEAFSEDNYEADDAASDLEFSGDEETVIEDSTDESTENIDAETSEGDEQTEQMLISSLRQISLLKFRWKRRLQSQMGFILAIYLLIILSVRS